MILENEIMGMRGRKETIQNGNRCGINNPIIKQES